MYIDRDVLLCGYEHINAGVQRGQEMVSDSLELVSQAVVSHQTEDAGN